jgi:zinc transport system substrate-binding protein
MQAFLKNPRRLIGAFLTLGLLGGLVVTIVLYQAQASQGHNLQVVATYYPLYNMAKIVGGDNVSVTNVTPAGAEPHDYEPTPQQLVQLQGADIVLYNGATFEPWINGFLSNYHHTAVAASRGIDLLPASNSASSTFTDPHFWLDPVLAKQITATIRDSFIAADPAHTIFYQQRAAEYINQLSALDTDYAAGLARCRLDTVIASHGALAYVSRRYGFDVQSIAGVSPDDEPSPATLAQLTKVVKQKGITTILFETLLSPKLAQTLASETGATAVVYDPIEGLTEAEQRAGKTYLSVQQQNLQTLRRALLCQ